MEIVEKVKTVASIIRSQNGKVVSVKFIKRTTGEVRTMQCKLGVKKHLTGGVLKYDPKDYQLLTVYSMDVAAVDPKKAYRSIPLDAVLEVTASGVVYNFEK